MRVTLGLLFLMACGPPASPPVVAAASSIAPSTPSADLETAGSEPTSMDAPARPALQVATSSDWDPTERVATLGIAQPAFTIGNQAQVEVTSLDASSLAEITSGARWMRLLDDGWQPPESGEVIPQDPTAADLAQAHELEELLAQLEQASPMFWEYPVVLAAIGIKDSQLGRRMLLEHLWTQESDPVQRVRSWSPAFSSLRFATAEPWSEEVVTGIACAIQGGPSKWFAYTYIVNAALARDQPADLHAVYAQLPPDHAAIFAHYVWLMQRTPDEVQRDFMTAGRGPEWDLHPALADEIAAFSHWPPPLRATVDRMFLGDLYGEDQASEISPSRRFELLWWAAGGIAPAIIESVQFGVYRTEDGAWHLIAVLGDKGMTTPVRMEHGDHSESVALLNAITADRRGNNQFFIAKPVGNPDSRRLMFGEPERLQPLYGLYRLGEPNFNLLTPLEADALPAECRTVPAELMP